MIGLDDLFTRLETALEAGNIAWWEIEFPSGVIFFSDLKATMIGCKPAEFTHYGQFIDLIHPDDRAGVHAALTNHLEDNTPSYEARYRIKHRRGHHISLYERGKVVYRSGEISKLAGIVIDVGGQKQAIEGRSV